MKIIELQTSSPWVEKGIPYFWKCWGNEQNFKFYEDCILNALDKNISLPKFYLAIENEKIIGSYALVTNDIISRQDLLPWLACLYVDENFRGKGIAAKLLQHGLEATRTKGFSSLYLSTDLEGFYEKKGWNFLSIGYSIGGESFKIYSKSTFKIP